ncbi:GH25 family lysozyme [Sciscionella marina]|uniref:GH25 family lysozyme n=1 Tax=Sciscionella marina TaxID=508770 RepID=UPI00037BDD99|nr:GH25 family lysozyme [Sciscionella marina]
MHYKSGIAILAALACTTLTAATATASNAPELAAKQALGVDVSNHNGSVDFKKVKASGREFSFVLASDGKSFSNKLFKSQYSGSAKAGLIHGAYHYARPNQSSAAQQAKRFLGIANYKHDGKTLPPVIDLEPGGANGCYGMSAKQTKSWITAFNKVVKDRTKHNAIIYTNPGFWSKCTGNSKGFTGNPLWVASWGVSKPQQVGGWKGYTFWQYSDSGKVPGVSGKTDLDKFSGSSAELKKFAEK